MNYKKFRCKLLNNRNIYYYSKNELTLIFGTSRKKPGMYFYNIFDTYNNCLFIDRYKIEKSTVIKYGLLDFIKYIRIMINEKI